MQSRSSIMKLRLKLLGGNHFIIFTSRLRARTRKRNERGETKETVQIRAMSIEV